MAERRRKSAKGTVVVQVFRDRLRLCWTFEGKRLYLYLGLPDSLANRKVAEMRARQIELDIASGNFDRTLAKYKPQSQQSQSLTVCGLFERFTQAKAKRVDDRTLIKYRALMGHLEAHFGVRSTGISDREVEQFRDYLSSKLEPSTLREWIGLLKAAWAWGTKQGLVSGDNPWTEIHASIKIAPKQRPKPFSSAEIRQILSGFRQSPHYAHYADFVEFLLGTGCRTGEAIALQWQHLSDDCAVVWIGESLSRGRRRATKTNKARQFRLSPRLQQLLQARKTEATQPADLVFPAPKGGAIDDHNFRNRAWKTVLDAQGIPYRKPYTTRSTFESHAIIEHGMNPAIVADITGHDPKTLFKHYLGQTRALETPDLTSPDP